MRATAEHERAAVRRRGLYSRTARRSALFARETGAHLEAGAREGADIASPVVRSSLLLIRVDYTATHESFRKRLWLAIITVSSCNEIRHIN